MLQIKTSFHPYRLKISRKEPIELRVSVFNPGPEDGLISFEVIVSRALSLDKGGLKSKIVERIGDMEARKTIEKNYGVFVRHITKPGTYPILIKAFEHYNNYSFVKKEYKKRIELIVEE